MAIGVVADRSTARLHNVRAAAAERSTELTLAALVVAAAALRFWRIGHQSFWYDESFTVMLLRHHSLGQVLGLLPRTELTPPLYYCLLWFWAHVFGYGEVGLRSLSAVAGVATVPVVFAAAAELVSRRAGLVAAALAACNPLMIWYSQEARSYAVLLLLASLSLLAFARIRSLGASRGRMVAWTVAAALTLATHYFGIVAVVPEALWLLWRHRLDRRVLTAVVAVAVVGGSLLPIGLTQRTNATWIADWPLGPRMGQIPAQLVLGTGAPARTWLKVAAAVAVALALVLLARRASSAERRGAILAGGLAAAGLALALVLIPIGVDELITRNVILILLPLIMLVAAGFGARRARALGAVAAAMLCVVGIVAAVGVALDMGLQRPDWRAVAAAIQLDPSRVVARAIVIERYSALLPLAIDLPGLHTLKPRGARVQEVDVIAADDTAPGWFCWWGASCNLVPAQIDSALRLPGFRRAGMVDVAQFSILRLRSDKPLRVMPRSLARALGRATYPDALMVQRP